MNDGGFWFWWQNLPASISPVIFQIGSFKLQYYGLMYILAFGCTYGLALYRQKHETRFDISASNIQDLTTALIVGLLVGARLGYVLFYNLEYHLQHPLEIILPFRFDNGFHFTGISGMSYHGGLIGTLIAGAWYCRKNKIVLRQAIDLFVPVIPLGYTFGRLGNFINGELYGRITEMPIGMHFPLATGNQLRHPSQLYEAFFEGIVLFVIMWTLKRIERPAGAMLAFYLVGYGLIRFVIEYFRQPDDHLGFVFLSFSMGQLLCGAMVLGGVLLYFALNKYEQQQA
jgi:phosphatidylglycerol---prolipoprotein diacylglyceryl transferase